LGGDVDCVDVEAAGGGRGRERLSVLRMFMPCTLLETLTVLMLRLVVERAHVQGRP